MYGKLEDFCNAFIYLLIISVYLKQFTLSRTEKTTITHVDIFIIIVVICSND